MSRQPFLYEGYQVSLRPISRGDASTFFRWRHDLESFHLMPASKEYATLEDYTPDWEAALRRTVTLLAVTGRDGRPAGFVQAYDVNAADGWCFVLSYQDPDWRSQRIGLEAAVAFWDYLFLRANIRKIYMDVAEFNLGWLRGAPGLEIGLLRQEGRFRQHLLYHGEYWDVLRIAVYQRRWLEVRDIALPLFGLGGDGRVRQAPPCASAPEVLPGRNPPPTLAERFGLRRRYSPRVELVRRYLRWVADGTFSEIVAMLADEFAYANPILDAEVTDRQEFVALLSFRNRMRSQAAQSGSVLPALAWQAFEEEEGCVTVRVAVGELGTVEVVWTFDSEDKVRRLTIDGPSAALANYLLSGELPPDS